VGDKHGVISKSDVIDLLVEFDTARFMELADSYSQPVSDLPTTILYIRIGDREKRVANYWLGRRYDPGGVEIENWPVHEALDHLAQSVDNAIGVDKWIGKEQDRLARFRGGPMGNPGATARR
jgi:hypothetical protein